MSRYYYYLSITFAVLILKGCGGGVSEIRQVVSINSEKTISGKLARAGNVTVHVPSGSFSGATEIYISDQKGFRRSNPDWGAMKSAGYAISVVPGNNNVVLNSGRTIRITFEYQEESLSSCIEDSLAVAGETKDRQFFLAENVNISSGTVTCETFYFGTFEPLCGINANATAAGYTAYAKCDLKKKRGFCTDYTGSFYSAGGVTTSGLKGMCASSGGEYSDPVSRDHFPCTRLDVTGSCTVDSEKSNESIWVFYSGMWESESAQQYCAATLGGEWSSPSIQ